MGASDTQVVDNLHERDHKEKGAFISRCTETYTNKKWKPPALRAPVLILTILTCWSLIAVLQVLLNRSQRDSGIIFATRISDLPLKDAFLYLYFPTVVAVTISIHWTWIDVETKRVEPYYQLSKPEGALGRDSLLLEYPFDFLPLVPIKALKNRHWPVFWASFAVVIVTLGLVPTQAGIFSTRSVTRSFSSQFNVFVSSSIDSRPNSGLAYLFAESTYGIMSLNETLPPFMAHNYSLHPVKITPTSHLSAEFDSNNGTWVVPTTMYYASLSCQDATHKADNSYRPSFTSDRGCNFTGGLTGNLTNGVEVVAPMKISPTKKFSAMYAGYANALLDYCNATESRTFHAEFLRNKAKEEDHPTDITAIFCDTHYWQQDVLATIDILTKRPLGIVPTGESQRLAPGSFNISTFESILTTNGLDWRPRLDVLPAYTVPFYDNPISNMDVSMSNGGTSLHPMAGLAILIGGKPPEKYLDWRALSDSYELAYQLLFARAMTEILKDGVFTSKQVSGRQEIHIQAVVMDPVFVYIVEAFLGIVSLSTAALLYLSLTRHRNLHSNPGTIASIMSLIADAPDVLLDFQQLDCCSTEGMKERIGLKRYQLVNLGSQSTIVEKNSNITDQNTGPNLGDRYEIARPTRPYEFCLLVGTSLCAIFLALATGLAVIYIKARDQGLPLPSNNSIVQNILEGYIPTAIATLIEPVWILINRLLCLLQPLEELRQCDARASNSIDLGYSSLPPQLVVFKALRAKHFILALVCVMSLLANLLAVALAGMFEHRTFDMARSAMFSAPMTFRFVPINGTIGYQTTPQDYGLLNSDLFLETSIMDAYLIADANVTRGTSLPMWVDDQFFYRPFFSNTSLGPAGSSEANTQVLGAELDCSPLKVGEYFRGELTPDLNTFKPTFNLTIDEGSSTFQCKLPSMTWFLPGPDNTRVQGPSAAEMILQMEPVNENSSRAEVEACVGTTILGWLRTTNHGGNLTIQTPTNENATFIQCKPKFLVGTATIRVDAAGRLLSKPKNLEIEAVRQNDTAGLFSNDPKYLIAQTHKQLFTDLNAEWHNDTITNQGTNYFIKHLANNTRLIDPTLPMPTFDDIMPSLNKAYSALFALWLATNKDILFIKQLDDSKVEAIAGWKTEPETRVFVVKPMFVIAEVIFIVYMFAIPLVYMRRPGRYLPRLPTSIAAVIALFAASTAVGDMKNTSHMDAKRRAQYLKNLDRRYGYGSYIGPDDGRVHIGIERIPFVRRRTKTTWLDKRLGK